MVVKIGFVTGARSEFGVMKGLIRTLKSDRHFEVKVYVTGMHLLRKYGNTYKEIIDSGVEITKQIPSYSESAQEKVYDFTNIVKNIYGCLAEESLDVIYIIGDRIEAYGIALAAHFLKIPIAHFAGGQITEGAVDNIYRYNISNLATLHFVTNKVAEQRLKGLPIIPSDKVFMVGSTAVDSIIKFLAAPSDISLVNPELVSGEFVLVTYHSSTLFDEPIVDALRATIINILARNRQVLITYPNNDDGSENIISEIKRWESTKGVFVMENLGADRYYTAVYHCIFVVGNSSSGIIEVPYFTKLTLNVGNRQKGRLKPASVIDVICDKIKIDTAIGDILDKRMPIPSQEYLYGFGDSVNKIKAILWNCFI